MPHAFKKTVLGLFAVSLSVAMAPAPGAYVQSDNANVAGLTVSGAPSADDALMVAIPVSSAPAAPAPEKNRAKHSGD